MTDPIAARGAQPGTEAGRALIADLMSSAKRMGPWQVADAILAIEAEARQQGRETLDVERLARAMHQSPGIVTSGWGYTPEEHLAECRALAPAIAAEYAALAADPRPETEGTE